jgi:probable HAF family extracellular repeat protein
MQSTSTSQAAVPRASWCWRVLLAAAPAILLACGGGSGDDAARPPATGSTGAPAALGAPPSNANPITPIAPATPASPPATTTYTVRVLDADGQAGPLALNAAGQVAFTVARVDGLRAMVFNGTAVVEVAGPTSRATALNASGQVTGEIRSAASGSRAFLWTAPGPATDLATASGSTSVGEAVNAAGQVTGSLVVGSQRPRAFLWSPATPMALLENIGGATNPGGSSEAVQINEGGAVIGNATTPTDAVHAVQWRPGQRIRDLGTLGGRDSTARGTNTAGDVVGHAETALLGQRLAFVASGTAPMRSLGALGGKSSTAAAINDLGQVAGEAETTGNATRAFLWEPAGGGTMRNLGTLGGTNSSAVAISAAGQVCGTSETTDGVPHAFVWSVAEGMVDLNTRLAAAPGGLVVQQCIAIAGRSVLALSSAGLVLLQSSGSR